VLLGLTYMIAVLVDWGVGPEVVEEIVEEVELVVELG